tara:strand:+ start:1174 stop:1587 length:414 start_codon:yes stop_codon:yes gene_type:complete
MDPKAGLTRRNKVQIVLVDDDEVFCTMLSKVVSRQEDMDLMVMSRLKEMSRYGDWDGVDLLILDYDLYDGTGLEAVDLMSKIAPNVPIVIASGTDRKHDASKDPRILGFISKWEANEAFVTKVRHFGALTKDMTDAS